MIIHSDFDNLKIHKENSSVDALKKLNETAKKVLFVVDDGKLLGTVTDGDIRRYILKTGKIKGKIEDFYNPNPTFISQDELDKGKVKSIFLLKKIEILPVVDRNLGLVGYLEWADILSKDHPQVYEKIDKEIPVVIMAGGKGTRMKPFTDVLPKPLIPLGDKTVIEHIIDNFVNFGLMKFILILNYKGRVIEAYFNSIKKAYNIEFVYEQEFLGTAGGLKLLENIITEDNFIVSNCDIILKCNFKDVVEFHAKNNSYFTSITSIQHYKIPYGVVNTKPGGVIESITEKPEYTFQINTGVYVLNKNSLSYIPNNEYFDMPSLIEMLIKDKQKVLGFPIKESDYIDAGQWNEYNKFIRNVEGNTL